MAGWILLTVEMRSLKKDQIALLLVGLPNSFGSFLHGTEAKQDLSSDKLTAVLKREREEEEEKMRGLQGLWSKLQCFRSLYR